MIWKWTKQENSLQISTESEELLELFFLHHRPILESLRHPHLFSS